MSFFIGNGGYATMRERKKNISMGICKLTLKEGRFVKSHILPISLTTLNNKGIRVIEKGYGIPKKNRFQGWYDNQLCIKEGERLLEEIDTKGIQLLRELKLLWSGWLSPMYFIPESYMEFPNITFGVGIRKVKIENWQDIQLFILSILWRAAASDRSDMKSFSLPTDIQEKIRLAVLNKAHLPYDVFPIRIYQIGTLGHQHNRTPFIEELTFDAQPPYASRKYMTARVYLDGMIAHVILNPDKEYLKNLELLTLGSGEYLRIFVHTYETSRAYDDLSHAIFDNTPY